VFLLKLFLKKVAPVVEQLFWQFHKNECFWDTKNLFFVVTPTAELRQ
jgi:hypothetical protein